MKRLRQLMFSAPLLMTGELGLASQLELPNGMGGVADIGAIPCRVFSEMLVVGPLGTRLSLLTWANGYFYARTDRTIAEIVEAVNAPDETWDFQRLTDHFADYCAENPEAITREAVTSLGQQLLEGEVSASGR